MFLVDWTSETLSRLHLSSKSLPGVLENVEVPEKLGKSRNPVKAPPILQVSPWSLEDVEVPEKLGNIRNPVKAPPVLQVWSLGGYGGS